MTKWHLGQRLVDVSSRFSFFGTGDSFLSDVPKGLQAFATDKGSIFSKFRCSLSRRFEENYLIRPIKSADLGGVLVLTEDPLTVIFRRDYTYNSQKLSQSKQLENSKKGSPF